MDFASSNVLNNLTNVLDEGSFPVVTSTRKGPLLGVILHASIKCPSAVRQNASKTFLMPFNSGNT